MELISNELEILLLLFGIMLYTNKTYKKGVLLQGLWLIGIPIMGIMRIGMGISIFEIVAILVLIFSNIIINIAYLERLKQNE